MITRFAPSPTGQLHLGHAYSALLAHDMAERQNGRFLLRIEDIDQSRARPEWETQIFEDLSWLGLHWEEPVMRQSSRIPDYQKALEDLWARGLLFACTCNRKDILAAVSAPQEGAPPTGPDGVIYPGTCRERRMSPNNQVIPSGMALRLDMAAALKVVGVPSFEEQLFKADTSPRVAQMTIEDTMETIGDVVLARKDFGTSYHFSVVLDDAEQGVTDVVRGEDLFEATFIHVVLQRLLGLETPRYHHHRLIRDENGKRLAKRDDARAIRLFRDEGDRPQDIRTRVGL